MLTEYRMDAMKIIAAILAAPGAGNKAADPKATVDR